MTATVSCVDLFDFCMCVVSVVRGNDILKVCTTWHSPRKHVILGVNKVTIPSQLVFEEMIIAYSAFWHVYMTKWEDFGA